MGPDLHPCTVELNFEVGTLEVQGLYSPSSQTRKHSCPEDSHTQLLCLAFQRQTLYSLAPSCETVPWGWVKEKPHTPLLKCSGLLWSWGIRMGV